MKLKISIEDGPHLFAGSSGVPEKGSPDLRQARRIKIDRGGKCEEEPVDYGTAVKGRLRTATEILLRTFLLRYTNNDRETIKELLPLDPTREPKWDDMVDFFGCAGEKGKWWVEEAPWKGDTKESSEDHIRLDEFTQNAMKGAKFDFLPLTGGETEVSVRLSSGAPDWQKELISHAGELLALNIIPWGGHGSRGYLGARVDKVSCKDFKSGSLKDLFTKIKKCN